MRLRMDHLDWNLLRAFHATATQGSLSAAARQLRLTQPTLSRQISALEGQLRVALFARVGRRLVLTEAGAALLTDVAGLVGDRLADQSAGFYAAPDWIAAHGVPNSLSDLDVSELIGMRDPAEFLHFMRAHGTPLGDGVPMLASDNAVAVWEMARRGLGVAIMLDDIAQRFPEMQRILPDLRPITVPLWLVAHRALYDSARLRRLRAALIAEFA